jgi:hypothetical protein
MLLPKPYPDEAVGSVLIRAQLIYGISIKPMLSWIHGSPTPRSSHSFHLVTEVDRVATLCGMEPREFLYDHTVFPYVTACLPKHYAANLEAKFLGATDAKNFSMASLVGNASQGAPMRRYCLHCASDDLIRHGETYWHRLHQLPTVLICPLHKAPLVQTGVHASLAHGKASLSLPSPTYVRPVTPPIEMGVALTLARLSEDLLMGRFNRDVDWHESYRQRASAKGLLHHYGDIAGSVSALALSELYGPKYLELLGCEVKRPFSGSWPALLLRSSRNQFVSVVRHLLMQAFLDHVRLDDRLRLLIDKVEKSSRTDFDSLDRMAETAMREEIGRHKDAGTRTTVRHLLSITGVGATFRHNRPRMPLSNALLEEFRRSDQSARQLGGNAHWRARTPSRWGLPSKRVLRELEKGD